MRDLQGRPPGGIERDLLARFHEGRVETADSRLAACSRDPNDIPREVIEPRMKMATSQIVEVVPSVAPMIIPTACEKVTSPALTKPMTVRMAAVED
jgi:hypothetical protein